MNIIEILEKISLIPAVSGNEEELSKYMEIQFGCFLDEVTIDKFNNVIGIKKGIGKNKKKIMISAHMDEIGLIVKSIDENGFIKISNIGGIDTKILLAQEVIVYGKKDLLGIIGAKPPHLLKPSDRNKAISQSELLVDIGMNKEQAEEFVSIGDVITFKAEPIKLKKNRFASKSLDNSAGLVVLLKTMKLMSSIIHENDIYFVSSVQEEVGLRGATMTSYNISPDVAIIVDVCPGEFPNGPTKEVFPLGKGPCVGVGPILNRKLSRKLIELSKDENIPVQIDVESGSTGTEAFATQVSKAGIPTALVSIPLRNMHTSVEMIQKDDLVNTAKLIAKIASLNSDEMGEILCF